MKNKLNDGKVYMKESVVYLVCDENHEDTPSGWYFRGNLDDCINYIKGLRNRNVGDGNDEYWHHKKMMIIKRIERDEEFVVL